MLKNFYNLTLMIVLTVIIIILIYKYTCLLRYGVQNDKNNSFLACIADVFSKEILKTNSTISIDENENIIIKSLTVDNFITYNNANLVQIFLNKNM